MLKYTGHPLFDIGVATIAAFAEKRSPEDLTEGDLTKIAEYMNREYVRQPLKSFLTVAFTSNAWFSQDAFNPDKPDLSHEQRAERLKKRDALARYHLWQWSVTEAQATTGRDVFTDHPATTVELSGRLSAGRAGRAQVPLLLGDEYINFYPYGLQGLPVSAKAVLALQAFPLGCAKVAGRLLAVHSDNGELTLHFAASFLRENRKLIQLAQQAGSSKLEEARYSQRTLLVDTLLQADRLQREARQDDRPFSLTAYHLTNSGQGVDLDIYYLPLQVTSFLSDMLQAQYRDGWSVIVHRAWEVAPPKKRGGPTTDFRPRRNYLYEDLFGLPDNAPQFLRTYFLRVALRYARADQGDPRGGYSPRSEADLVSWKITARFLRRIMNMEKVRIEAIRNLGDRLADYVSSQNDRRFFRDFFTERRYDYFRTALIKANIAHVRRGNPPLIALDPYIAVFEEGDEVARADWQFARDLVLIRMIEQLYNKGWLGAHPDALPAETEEATADAT
ncbi:MAG: hypothetical protein WHS86_10740 [Desulfosoma sp.]